MHWKFKFFVIIKPIVLLNVFKMNEITELITEIDCRYLWNVSDTYSTVDNYNFNSKENKLFTKDYYILITWL